MQLAHNLRYIVMGWNRSHRAESRGCEWGVTPMQTSAAIKTQNLEQGLYLQEICTRIDKARNLRETLGAMIPEMAA